MRHVLEPIFERDFAECSYGFRPGRGCREAVGRVEEWLSQGYVGCVDADLESFDTIPHEGFMALVKQRVVDGSVLVLVEQCLKAGAMEELQGWQPTERGPSPRRRGSGPAGGTPQGAAIRPTLGALVTEAVQERLGSVTRAAASNKPAQRLSRWSGKMSNWSVPT